jgi:GT2 family glycosyltransferase
MTIDRAANAIAEDGVATRLALPLVSFVIKAFNEEAKIAACIESVLKATREVPGRCEVILADSVSSDRTVAIAQAYPVRIVQLRDANQRGCGAGVQLGYQHASGQFVFLLDGDMQVHDRFVPVALAALQADPGLAGVAGLLIDVAVRNAFDHQRVSEEVSGVARDERWLNGGGLYRRSAIEQAGGYAADLNLKGWEEAELGMRLRAAGWRLRRIAVLAVRHDGHLAGTGQMLRRLWVNGRAFASGVLLRQAWGRPWWRDALRLLAEPLLAIAWWVVGLASLAAAGLLDRVWPLLVWAAASLMLAAFMVVRKRSVRRAALSLVLWHFLAGGLLRGLLLPRRAAAQPIPSVDCSSPGAAGMR